MTPKAKPAPPAPAPSKPPERRIFDSWKDALKAISTAGMHKGYAYRIKEKYPAATGDEGLVRVKIRCSRGLKFKTQKRPGVDERRRRATKTRMSDCPVRATIQRLPDAARWVINGNGKHHNHEPADSVAEFARERLGALNELRDDIMRRWGEGARPRQILAALRNLPEPPDIVRYASEQDIRNIVARQASLLARAGPRPLPRLV